MEFEVTSAMSDTGEVRVGVQLTPETLGSLLALDQMPHWKIYRDILIAQKSEFMNAILPMDEPHKVMKQVGVIAGMNHAINQIGIIVAEHKKSLEKRQKVEEATAKKGAKVFKRG